MKKTTDKQKVDKVKFPISAKLIIIITIIVLFSLGSITMLVSWLVREDVKIEAEVINFDANRRSASEAEDMLGNMRIYSRVLIQVMRITGHEDAQATANYFFEQNRQAAAISYVLSGQEEYTLASRDFFSSRNIDSSLANSYFKENIQFLRQASAGETIVLNASPYFGRPLIALFFPLQDGGAGFLFSSEKLNESFGSGSNPSYLINDKDDILAHLDSSLLLNGANVAEDNFIRQRHQSQDRNLQIITEDETGHRFYSAYTKLNIGDCAVITSIEYDKVFEGINATTRRNFYLTAAVLFISIMFIWFFAKNISIPLKALAAAARNIEGGQFEQEVTVKRNDEIGLLGRSFKRMSSALQIFGRFTNRDLAVKAMRGEIKPGGLPKHATIFFSDIRGFTEKSENFTNTFGDEASDRIVFWLNNYLSKMIECVEKTGGVVDKFIGDAVMAHWGTAYTSGKAAMDAYNCVNAALMMRSAIISINKDRRNLNDPGNPPIQIGCGINTGIVTAGQIGSDIRMEYTVIGDPVNLASRVESLNKPFGTDILITENTLEMVSEYFITEEMPPVTVKGKTEPVRIFAVINYADAKDGPKTLAEVRKLLEIPTPNTSKAKTDTEEKYSIGKKVGKNK